MIRKILLALVFLIGTGHANALVHVMPDNGFSGLTDAPSAQVIKSIASEALAHEHINIGGQSPYASVQIKFIQTASQRYLLIHLLSRYYFSYQIVRVNLNAQNAIQYPILTHYHLTTADFSAERAGDSPAACPTQYQTGKPLFVIGTPYNKDFQNIAVGVDALVKQLSNNNNAYQLVELLDKNATIQNYENVLACPNLKYFFHMGHSDVDDNGQAFVLKDGDFNATYFAQNPQLNLRNKIITLDSCELFDQVNNGFCPILGDMPNPLQAYSSGSSDLLIFGSVETYTCFWMAVLNGAPATQNTLAQCALAADPSMKNSRSGVYFLSDSTNPIVVTTNERNIVIPPNSKTQYDDVVLKLNPGEMVTQYAMEENNGRPLVCTPYTSNKVTLLNNPGLTAGEFQLFYQSNPDSCQFAEISRLPRDGGLTRDIYGFYPTQACFNVPTLSNAD